MELTDKTLIEIKDSLAKKEISVLELVTACLKKIEQTEKKINAFITLRNEEELLEQAKQLDSEGYDPQKPLWGIPIGIKDVFTTKGIKTTCGSKILENFVPVYDAEVVTRLKEAGAIILGKQNMDEFAMGSSTENSAFGPTKNPWDISRVPGGSSGGSAASVAAKQCFAAIGTDTGGSIRQPACFCGLVGVKPTYGRVSRYGLIAYGSSFDQAGPLTKTIKDAALILNVIAGHDPKDSTSLRAPVPDYLAQIKHTSLKGVSFGIPKEYFQKGLDQEVENSILKLIDILKQEGAEIKEISLPHTEYAIATYYILVMAEASSNLARFDGVRYGFRAKQANNLKEMYELSRTYGFGDEVQRRIMLGTYVLSAGYYDAYYKKAAQVRRILRKDFDMALQKCDYILAPVSPTPAFKLGEHSHDPLKMYLTDIYTISLNLVGLPGISLPIEVGKLSGLPLGIQLIGKWLTEEKLFQVAFNIEQLVDSLSYPNV
ncbi:aspartyl/glutamyl-tRNA(Asn/Gln) amidotransferase subunit A [Desulfonauticus submarinus]|uniref:Glutamyl-tRNA(Gln) amidotransferase subunit A n=1 Tax=Desulfonauticus submarinus TaxID=206665 RepID=A0A1H0CM32_9BACT|nr:Asp-tRNA(Asn)/Glu-tRNA(Gln) amidotransferase subunit GatA [Desulfonauticus submarinus]SDN58821.1 aspartyl/glutamyl-tRNA(Asn/Gln) amidotransferase subunit A [Desulfonauticus submarinus]